MDVKGQLKNKTAFAVLLEKDTSLIQNAHPCRVSVCSVCRGKHIVHLSFVELNILTKHDDKRKIYLTNGR